MFVRITALIERAVREEQATMARRLKGFETFQKVMFVFLMDIRKRMINHGQMIMLSYHFKWCFEGNTHRVYRCQEQ